MAFCTAGAGEALFFGEATSASPAPRARKAELDIASCGMRGIAPATPSVSLTVSPDANAIGILALFALVEASGMRDQIQAGIVAEAAASTSGPPVDPTCVRRAAGAVR
jgi:hypothetical protein